MSKNEKEEITLQDLLGEAENTTSIYPISALVLGESKIGKSTFAASSANPQSKTLMLNFEYGLSFIQEFDYLRIFPRKRACTMKDLRDIYKALCEPNPIFSNIVFDTGDEFWNILTTEFLAESGKKRMEIQDYIPLYNKYLNILKNFKNLGLNIIITAHTKRFEDDPKRVIALSEKLGKQVGAWVDMILHLTLNSKGERVLITQPTPLLDAGHRSIGEPLSKEIHNPTWDMIIDGISGKKE